MEPLTSDELQHLAAYHAPYYTSALVDLVTSPLLSVGALFLVRPMHRVATRWTARWHSKVMERVWGDAGWAPSLVFALLYFGGFALLSLPREIFLGYFHEHAFGLSNESAFDFAKDALKSYALFAFSVSSLAIGLFGIARKTSRWWWLVGAASLVALVVSTAIDPYRARLYVHQESLPAGVLRTRLTELLSKAQVSFSDIAVVHTGEKSVRVNAAFAGTGPTRTVLLTDTLLTSMTEAEIASAVAHEAGHLSESKWPGRVLTPLVLIAFLMFIEAMFVKSARAKWWGIETRGDIRVLPLLALVFDLGMTAVTPFTAWASRERELEADLYGVTLTRDIPSMESLLLKVGRINRVDPDPPRWYVWSGVSHPSITERVARLELQKNATPPPTTPVTEGTSEQQEPGVMR